jgi:hypothetical protein
MSRQIFEKFSNIKFHKNSSNESWVLSYGQTCHDRFLKNSQISNFIKIRPMKAEFFHADRHVTTDFWNNSQISNFIKIRPMRAEFCHADRHVTIDFRKILKYQNFIKKSLQWDLSRFIQTDMKLIVFLIFFANSLKTRNLWSFLSATHHY